MADWWEYLLSIVLMVGGAALVIWGISMDNFLGYSIAILGCVLAISGWMMIKMFSEMKENIAKFEEKKRREETARKKFLQEHPHHEAEEFYKKCVAAGINDVNTDAQKGRLSLLAKNNGVEGTQTELIRMFHLGKAEVLKVEKNERIKELAPKERELETKQREFEQYFGREKYLEIYKRKIAECKKTLWQCESSLNAIDDGGVALYQLGKQKETNAAIHGGIASAIAGGAAGVATAMHIEAENAQIRAENQALYKDVVNLQVGMRSKVWERKSAAENQLKNNEERYKKAELVLVDERDPKDLMGKLNISLQTKTVSETGSLQMKIKVEGKPLKIYSDVDAVVDGTIKVHVLNDGTKIGETLFCLSDFGMRRPETFDVICRNLPEMKGEVQVRFEPGRLWAVETSLY